MAAPRRPRHVCLFDGVCALCNGAVRFLLRHDRAGRFVFATLQGRVARETLARHGARADALDTIWVVRDAGTPREALLSRSRAVTFALSELGHPWCALGVLALVPRPVLDVLYDLVARSRYRLFGRLEDCPRPPPGWEQRFLRNSTPDPFFGLRPSAAGDPPPQPAGPPP